MKKKRVSKIFIQCSKIRVRTIRVTWLSSLGATSVFFFLFFFLATNKFWKFPIVLV
jgi:hypothetical protein